MALRKHRRVTRPQPPRRKRGSRATAVTLGVGVALVLVFALVFSVSFGSKGVAQHADALHNADEALRAATVARAQAGMATHLGALEREFDFDAAEGIEVALRDTRFALNDLTVAVDEIEQYGNGDTASIESSAAAFSSTVGGIIDAVEAGDTLGAQSIATESLDRDFRLLTGAVVVERDYQASQVAAANDLMGRIGDLARFLVAFLVPTAAIVLYRELARRQTRQKELEVRLETEQELGKARDEFVANASHELRTPLTSIFGLAHLLEEDEVVRSSPSDMEMVGMIISETHDLTRMVDDLLTTARLDAGGLHYQFENLPVLEEVVSDVVEPMRRAGIAVEVDCQPALVRSDRLRLRQVLRNLLSNAGKYGGPNVRLHGRVTEGWYEVRVEDDGEGIPPELEARLFQRFLHQGDMPLVLGSVGLGLSIVRALAEGMGGAVWYERSDGWSSFVVRVSLAQAGAEIAYREPLRPAVSSEPAPVPQPVAAAAAPTLGPGTDPSLQPAAAAPSAVSPLPATPTQPAPQHPAPAVQYVPASSTHPVGQHATPQYPVPAAQSVPAASTPPAPQQSALGVQPVQVTRPAVTPQQAAGLPQMAAPSTVGPQEDLRTTPGPPAPASEAVPSPVDQDDISPTMRDAVTRILGEVTAARPPGTPRS